MADGIHVFGKDVNVWVVIGSVAGVATLVYMWKKGGGSSSSAAGGSAIDPLTGLPYSQDSQVDPLTGMTYLTEAQQYGSVSAAESAVQSGSAYSGSYYSGGGLAGGSSGTAGYPTLSGSGTPGTTPGGYSTNAQWANAVTSGLAGLGYDATDVAAALGLYLAGQPLGTAPDGVSYLSIVQAAVAEFGPPPVGQHPITGSNTNQTPPPQQTQVAVPNVVGEGVTQAEQAISAVGLEPGVSGPSAGTVTSQSPSGGTMVSVGSQVTIVTGMPQAPPPPPPAGNPGNPQGPIVVPDVTGMSLTEGYHALEYLGLVPRAVSGGSGASTILSQSPAPGSRAFPKDVITLQAEGQSVEYYYGNPGGTIVPPVVS